VLALDRHLVVREQRLDPARRARARGVDADDGPPEVDGMQAVDVLLGVDREERGLLVEL